MLSSKRLHVFIFIFHPMFIVLLKMYANHQRFCLIIADNPNQMFLIKDPAKARVSIPNKSHSATVVKPKTRAIEDVTMGRTLSAHVPPAQVWNFDCSYPLLLPTCRVLPYVPKFEIKDKATMTFPRFLLMPVVARQNLDAAQTTCFSFFFFNQSFKQTLYVFKQISLPLFSYQFFFCWLLKKNKRHWRPVPPCPYIIS